MKIYSDKPEVKGVKFENGMAEVSLMQGKLLCGFYGCFLEPIQAAKKATSKAKTKAKAVVDVKAD